jgi:hypothetical protein
VLVVVFGPTCQAERERKKVHERRIESVLKQRESRSVFEVSFFCHERRKPSKRKELI